MKAHEAHFLYIGGSDRRARRASGDLNVMVSSIVGSSPAVSISRIVAADGTYQWESRKGPRTWWEGSSLQFQKTKLRMA
jgi:hypothetical protein